MKYLVLAFLLGVAIQVVEPPEYAPGVLCSPGGDIVQGRQTPDHPCACKNMGDPQTSCEKPTTNDPVCRQYCHEQHCACPLICESLRPGR